MIPPRRTLSCQKCGHTWKPLKPKPKQCPNCQRPLTEQEGGQE